MFSSASNWLRTLTLIISLGGSAIVSGQSLYDFPMKRLDEISREPLVSDHGDTMLVMLFEPECSWCLKQSHAINALLRQCEDINAAAVGLHGDRQALSRTYRRFRADFPGYQASRKFIDALGGVSGTPFTLLADAEGEPLGWLQGYVPLDRLRSTVTTLTGGTCATELVAEC